MDSKEKHLANDTISTGNVYVMSHSFFSDVVRIGCTPNDPNQYAKELSANTPGDYSVAFSLACNNPCQVKKQIREYLNAQAYVNEFYQVPAEVAEKLLRREALKIPILSTL
jgi:hypothetical protein